jgi:hypothetical protein
MLTRRDFVAKLAVAGAAIGAFSTARGAICAAAPPARPAVVSIHMDQPYIDVTGTAMPYRPPSGARSAEPVAHLAEEAFRGAHCYV